MDGFHLGNDVLEHRGLLARKGAPDTFDAESFVGLVKRSQTEPTVKVPVFDRENDRVIPNAAEIAPHHRTLVAEGNYLLLDQTPWHQLADIWAVQVFLDVPADRLRSRLVQRWRDHGLSQVDAERRTAENDLPNALYVQQNSRLNGQYSIRLRSD
jgi:pantothenate kinase